MTAARSVCHNRNQHAPHFYHPCDGDHAALTVMCPGLRDGWTDGEAFAAFVAMTTDDERMALGPEVLRAALAYARDRNQQGWAESIHEYVYALESGKGLNRPL